jgi:endonuclease-3
VPPSVAAAREILARLESQHPGADTELNHRNAFELLIATILSAQSTDQRVNLVTPSLFAKYPDAHSLAAAEPQEVEPLIIQTGFFRQKSKSIVAAARLLVSDYGGEVPADMEALTRLPGVGRKTANVVLGHTLGVPGLPVDRHVLRVANRIGLVRSEDPEEVEQQLCAMWPREEWTQASDTLILHGRRICRPKPSCEICAVRDDCEYFAHLIADRPSPKAPSRAAKGSAARARPPIPPGRPRTTKTPRAKVVAPTYRKVARARGKKKAR